MKHLKLKPTLLSVLIAGAGFDRLSFWSRGIRCRKCRRNSNAATTY